MPRFSIQSRLLLAAIPLAAVAGLILLGNVLGQAGNPRISVSAWTGVPADWIGGVSVKSNLPNQEFVDHTFVFVDEPEPRIAERLAARP